MFQLLPNLDQKDFIIDLPLCRVLLEDNRCYRWLFLVPRKENIRNLLQLSLEERFSLMREISLIETVFIKLFNPDRINIASIGNKTPQLHIHVIARYSNDPDWPETVWGKTYLPYTVQEKAQIIDKITGAIRTDAPKLGIQL